MIRQADWAQTIKSCNDGSSDCIILDPNYEDWGKFIKMGIIEKSLKKISETGNLILFTKKPYDFLLRNYIDDIFVTEIIWQYKYVGSWVSNRKPLMTYQKIYICAKSKKDCFFSQSSGLEYSSRTKDGVVTQMQFKGYKQKTKPFEKKKNGKQLSDFLFIPRKRQGEDGFIPSKPLKLCSALLNTYCKPSGLVVDPFCGGGNLVKTARILGHDFIAGDISDKCVDFAKVNVYQNNEIHGRIRDNESGILKLF